MSDKVLEFLEVVAILVLVLAKENMKTLVFIDVICYAMYTFESNLMKSFFDSIFLLQGYKRPGTRLCFPHERN